MGAEGSIVIMPRWQWDQHTDRQPGELGFYSGRIVGTEAVWSYHGENTDYEMAVEMYPPDDDARELVKWFAANAETHEVWT